MKTIIEFIKDDPADIIGGFVAWAGLLAVVMVLAVIWG